MKRIPIAAMLTLVLLLVACGGKTVSDAKNWDLEDFSYTDQNNEELAKADLKGKVWIADFIFTSCEDICLPMTANLQKLQQMVKDENLKDVEFVSFSIDPEVDKPEVMKSYGTSMKADFSNWHFLTGYSQSEIEKFALDNFKTLVQKPEGSDQVVHGTSIYLVDQKGKIMKDYRGVSDVPFDNIIKDIKILQNY